MSRLNQVNEEIGRLYLTEILLIISTEGIQKYCAMQGGCTKFWLLGVSLFIIACFDQPLWQDRSIVMSSMFQTSNSGASKGKIVLRVLELNKFLYKTVLGVWQRSDTVNCLPLLSRKPSSKKNIYRFTDNMNAKMLNYAYPLNVL